jgi:hypothetical protein
MAAASSPGPLFATQGVSASKANCDLSLTGVCLATLDLKHQHEVHTPKHFDANTSYG